MLCGVKKSSEEKTSELSMWLETIPSYLDIYISKEHVLLGSCNYITPSTLSPVFSVKKREMY